MEMRYDLVVPFPKKDTLARAKRLRRSSTAAEAALWDRLRDRQVSHDVNRDANLQALGYRVLRFTNQQIEEEIELVLGAIRRLKLKRTLSPLSRKGAWEDGREGPGE